MKEPTMEEVLELVRFSRDDDGKLHVSNVYGDVLISVHGDVGIVHGNVNLSVHGSVFGDVWGSVFGDVYGKILNK